MSSEALKRITHPGATFTIRLTWKDEDGALYDPGSQSWQLYKPDGTASGDPETGPTKQSVGVYDQEFTIPTQGENGEWLIIATATTAAKSVEEHIRILVVSKPLKPYCTGLDVLHHSRIPYGDLGFSDDGDYLGFIEGFIIPAVETVLDDYCLVPSGFFRAGGATVTDEYHDGDGGTMIWTDYYPILSVTSLHRNKAALNATPDWEELQEGPGEDKHFIVWSTTGIIYVFSNTPSAGYKNIKITYTTGFTSTPEGVSLAAKEIAAAILRGMNKRRIIPQQVSQIAMEGGDLTAIFAEDLAMTRATKSLLTKFRRLRAEAA